MSLQCFVPRRRGRLEVVREGLTAGQAVWITDTHANVDILHAGRTVAVATFRAGRGVEVRVTEPPTESKRLFALDALERAAALGRPELVRMSERLAPPASSLGQELLPPAPPPPAARRFSVDV